MGSPYVPKVGSPLLGAASFDGEASSWFEKVDFVGAFGANGNWLEGWTNFDPQHIQY